ncbi:hypothetical protein CGMCC3_g5912 [Colletotrichum fructicola]|nr:uncharacterized protein CGMCC3_g5912 [Colletotrichum fructicola]KAE9578098.1 hypothetical protein CGMCC3_g5912 [Colletotrichum fructicola]
MDTPLKVAILIVSTTASKDPSTDKSELVLKDVIEQEGGGKWVVTDSKIVPDLVPQIQRQIMLWADVGLEDGANLILTTGGTGFAVSDSTPEAVSALIHRPAPGLVHGMIAASLAVTPFAMMSRPVAGVRNKTVIITLPGSPKGAKENLQAVLKTLPHAFDDALRLIQDFTPEAEIVTSLVDVKIVNSVLAEDVTARENVPAFRASIVDGYAVVVPKDGNMKGVFPVTSVSHAAPGEAKTLKEGEIARITTGAPLPPGATSVIMVEDTILKSKTSDDKEEKEVEILAEGVKPGENIREIGSDVKEGDLILKKGEQISGVGGEIGLLASVGVAEAKTYKRPVVGILSTGDEIIEPDRPGGLRLGEVRDTNRITLMSAARQWGFDVVDLGIARDKPGSLEENLREGLRRSDLLITTGGVSMGELDLLKPTIERSLGGTIHFGRVAMKPGKPTTFATVPVKNNAGERVTKTIFSLPGNPASALVTFHLFVIPALHKLSGIVPTGLPKVPVTLSHDFTLDKQRAEYHRAVVTVGKDGLLSASSTGGQRSSKVGSLRSANALLALPKGTELKKGTKVGALLMGEIRVEL